MKIPDSKSIIYFLFSICLWGGLISCDIPRRFTVNDVKDYSLSSECGTLTVRSFSFMHKISIAFTYTGELTFQPDSLKIEFFQPSIEAHDMKYYLDGEEIIPHEVMSVENSTIRVQFIPLIPSSEEVYPLNTIKAFILPSNFLMCNDQPLLTDTITINFR